MSYPHSQIVHFFSGIILTTSGPGGILQSYKKASNKRDLFLLPIQSQKVHGRMRQGNKPLERKVLHTDPVGCSSGILGYPTSSGKGRAGGISSQRVPELQMKLHLGHLSMFSDESPHDMWPCPTVHPSDLAVVVVVQKHNYYNYYYNYYLSHCSSKQWQQQQNTPKHYKQQQCSMMG